MSNKALFCFQNSSPPLDTGNQNICGYLRYSESYLMLMIIFDFTTLFRAETVGDWASPAGGLLFPSMRQTGSLLKERIQRQGRGWSQTKRRLWKTRDVPSPTFCFVWACEHVYVLVADSPFLSAGTELRGWCGFGGSEIQVPLSFPTAFRWVSPAACPTGPGGLCFPIILLTTNATPLYYRQEHFVLPGGLYFDHCPGISKLPREACLLGSEVRAQWVSRYKAVLQLLAGRLPH